jgi:hypothetical protein
VGGAEEGGVGDDAAFGLFLVYAVIAAVRRRASQTLPATVDPRGPQGK